MKVELHSERIKKMTGFPTGAAKHWRKTEHSLQACRSAAEIPFNGAAGSFKKLQPDAGFTLLEIMVAVSIIAIVLVSVYKMHAQTISMNFSVQFYTTAPLLAQRIMTEMEIKPPNELADDAGDFGDNFPNYRWNVAVNDVESEALGQSADDLKKIDVAISFNNDELIYRLRTYRFFRDE